LLRLRRAQSGEAEPTLHAIDDGLYPDSTYTELLGGSTSRLPLWSPV
jgi:hypothetical protein